MNKFPPLNPEAEVKPGRLDTICWIVSKTFSDAEPDFNSFIKIEDQVNANLICEFAGERTVICRSSQLYKESWSFMRPVGMYKPTDIVMLACMAAKGERDAAPRGVLVFRISDKEVQVIPTRSGERDAQFFDTAKRDTWGHLMCEPRDSARVIRSVITGVVDPEIISGPFRSHLTTLLAGNPATTVEDVPKPQNGSEPSLDFDNDIPFS